MRMSSELALLDTNVLVGSLYADDYRYPTARPLLDQAQNEDAGLCLVPQVLTEFYAVVTNPDRVSEKKSSSEALEAIRSFLALPGLTLLPVPVDVVDRLVTLLEQHPVERHHVFDVQLVAAMLGNGVKKIYTYNVRHFTRFAEIEATEPTTA